MEYEIVELLDKLGALVNKCQNIRNGVPVEMKEGDARHVCLSGIQNSIASLMLSCGAIEAANQSIPNIDLSKISGVKGQTNEIILQRFETWAQQVLLTLVHFHFEALFSNLLRVLDPSKNNIRGFEKIATELFAKITITDPAGKLDALKVMSMFRNSLHNNSINRNPDFTATVHGTTYSFIKGQPTQGTIFNLITLIDSLLSNLSEVVSSPQISAITTAIPDDFQLTV